VKQRVVIGAFRSAPAPFLGFFFAWTAGYLRVADHAWPIFSWRFGETTTGTASLPSSRRIHPSGLKSPRMAGGMPAALGRAGSDQQVPPITGYLTTWTVVHRHNARTMTGNRGQDIALA